MKNGKARKTLGFLLSCSVFALGIGGASIQVMAMLTSFGFSNIFDVINLGDVAKVQVALYLTLPVVMVIFALLAGVSILKGYTHFGGTVAFLSLASGLLSLGLINYMGYSLSFGNLLGTASSISIMGIVAVIGFTTPSIEVKRTMFMTTAEVAVASVFSALTSVLTGVAFLPSPTGGYTHIGDTMIFLAALLFGYKVGGIVGVIGPVAADLFVGYSRWFVTIPAHGAEGLIAGFGKGRSTVVQVLLCIFGGFVMATTYFYVNVFIKGYPLAILSYLRDLFGQALISMILGIILTRIVKKALPQLEGF
jgi:uncharacterized membrane protein